MASSLEVAKLVIASLLYQYWDKLNKLLRVYLTIAAAVLILITSMGIYGFLSAAYQETANKAGNIDAQITLVETKRDNIQKQLSVYNVEKENTDKAIADLRKGLSNNVISYTNAEGQLITTTSSATRKALEKQLDQAIERQTELNGKVDGLNTQLFDFETEIVEIKTGNDVAGELGPLKYLSGLTGVPMDKIINVLLLIIIFVFDPLAIALVIAANFAFSQLIPKTRENIYGEKVIVPDNEGTDIFTEDELKEWDSTLMDGLEEEEWSDDEFDLDGDGVLNKKEQNLKQIDQLLEDIEQIQSSPMDFQNKQSQVEKKLKEIKKLRQENDDEVINIF